ncbi:MAG TPA: cytochrome c peroxidase [Dongiaceae bacterium]|nr:cytochrome c peroxidase [Dongiaceae bacterium]
MAISFCLKSLAVKRLLSAITICSLLPGSFAWGALQPPLSRITNPVFGTSGGTVPATVPPNLSPYIKDVTAAIRLGKALFWDMQAGSDGVTACASCHYRAGADPVVGTAPKLTAKRDRNQLHPGPDIIFGNNSTIIKTFNQKGAVDPVTLLPVPVTLRATGFPIAPNVPGTSRFAPNYTLDTLQDPLNPLDTFDFPLFLLNPPTARLAIDPLTGLTSDAVLSLRDTNDVIGSQGVRLAQFSGVNGAVDISTPLTDQLFRFNGVNIRQVTGRNAPSVINAVFNYTNFWDGRANNIFNGVNPFGPLDQTARIWVNAGTAAAPVLQQQPVAIPNSSLASQAVGPPLNDVEMSFKGRTFPQLGKKMLGLRPLDLQLVHPNDRVFSVPSQLSRASLLPDGTITGNRGLDTDYTRMIEAAFVDKYWNYNQNITLPEGRFTQIEANFSLFWGLAIQLYEATLVSDRAPFDRFQDGNQNALNASEQAGFATFDSKCTICHSGSEFSSAVVGSNIPGCVVPDCNRVVFTNNSTHTLIKQDVNPGTFANPGLIDAGFFNIGVRPTADDPGRGGSKLGFPLSFSRLALQASRTGLPFVTPKLSLQLPDKVQGSFKTPGLRNVELTAPYFHNGDALTLDQVVEFYTRGGNFPGNPELAANMQAIGNLRQNADRRAEIVAFLKKLTDERVRNETAPFDHPELMIPNGADFSGFDTMITLNATGGAAPEVPITTLTIKSFTSPTDPITPVTSPTSLTALVISGTVDETATVAVDVTNTTFNVSLPKAIATVGGTAAATVGGETVGGTIGGVVQPAGEWNTSLTGLTPGLNTIKVTATSVTGGTKSVTANIQITPTAIISGVPPGGRTTQNFATLTIGGSGVKTYQYSLDGGPTIVVDSVSTPITLTNLPDGTHTVAVFARDVIGIQQLIATTATWTVKATPPVLTLNAASLPTGSSNQTIGGTVELGSFPQVSIDTGATIGPVKTIPGIGISSWSCEITGLAAGANNFTVIALDGLFNETTVKGVITRIFPDGDIMGDGVTDISDALKAMRIAVGLEQPTAADMLHGDVAPLVNGKTTQNGQIDIDDALLILRKIIGFVTF